MGSAGGAGSASALQAQGAAARVGADPTTAASDGTPGNADGGRRPTDWSLVRRAVAVYAVTAAALTFVVAASLVFMTYTTQHGRPTFFRRQPWFDGWFRWDAGWYFQIAERGYWEYAPSPDNQSPVAYFPAYPLLMRLLKGVFGNVVIAGIAVTMLSGAAIAGLFADWTRRWLDRRAAWTAVLLVLFYPFAYYLYGAVYADALFIATMLGGFVLLERDRPVLAGLVAAVGTAARPVGALVVIAFAIRAIERRGGLRKLQRRDAGVLLSALGTGGYCLYTWWRFGTPLAFVHAQQGWQQGPGPSTWFKTEFLHGLEMFSHRTQDLVPYLLHPITTLICLAFVPMVVKRFGWGYGVYVLLVIALPALSTKNFFGMGRYVLAAFPSFAAAALLLATRPKIRAAVVAVGGALMVAGASYFSRGFYLS